MSGQSDPEPPQPLVVRGTDSMPWGDYSNQQPQKCLDYPSPTSSGSRQQVSFRTDTSNMMKQSRSEPISLSTLDRDCFIIPVQRLDRFLPAGLPVPVRINYVILK